MKKYFLTILVATISFYSSSQSFIGYLSDNYSGVNKVVLNPADIVNSPHSVDVNLLGASVFGSNNYYGINILDATKDGYSFDLESKKHPLNDNRFSVNVDVLGPAVSFNLSPKSALAVFTRARAFVNLNEIDGASIASIDDDTTESFNVTEGNFSILSHAWTEIGVSFAHEIIDEDEHIIKGGLSLKYMQGRGSAYAVGDNFNLIFDEVGIDLGGGNATGSINTSGNIQYARFDEFDGDDYDYERPENADGFGVDFGVTYEWKPNKYSNVSPDPDSNTKQVKQKSNYKLKLGLSVTDIGYINYKDGVKEAYNITNTNVSEDDFLDANDLSEFLNNFYSKTDTATGYIVDLPTALHFNADWNFNNKFYLNLNTDFSLIPKNRITANRITNIVSLTPRFESKWFGFYVPLSIVQNNGFRMGAGLRAGPLYIGSGTLVSAITSDNNRGADVFAGLKAPMFKRKNKDRDRDGVINKLDNCPRIPGPTENNGCPWEDRDQDGILDNEDQCPDQAGPAENNGCPWGDADKDGITDNEDECPSVFGLKQNKGCPYKDTDGDGVYDKDDICINEFGTKANNGCPEEVIEKLQHDLDDYAKVILFKPDTADLQDKSIETLNKIIEVMEKYPNATFTIEGHTDSRGTYKDNQMLSEKRAATVKNYLLKKGVDAVRLSSIGYGERKPIATNMYMAGRAKNRRVEIRLVK